MTAPTPMRPMSEPVPGRAVSEREPPMPAVGVALIIRAASDPTIALPELGRLIDKEPTLTLNLLKLANSAAYSTGREVRSVGQATMLLGARAIRNIAVAHTVRAMSERVDTGAFDARLFWEDSLRRACAALVIARQAGYEDPSEAFTVGLIQDLGVLMMAATRPEASGRLQRLRGEPAAARICGEAELSGRAHSEIFVSLGRAWGLPPDLVDAVAFHHADVVALPDRRTNRLAQIARAADLIADITQTQGAGDTVLRARAIIGQLESRAPLGVDALVDATVAEMAAQSKDLEIRIEVQPSYQELMEGANKALLQTNLSYEELTQRLEQALRDKEELAVQLGKTNEALRRLATTDPLTGVGNRRSFAEAIGRLLGELAEHGQPLTIISLDLDHFKRVNDQFGHAAGDDVLIAVAQRLLANLRGEDVVGRLGGEEFGILLPKCSERDGRVVAERLRLALRVLPVRCRDGTLVSVTGSFGALTVRQVASADAVLRAADAAMYASKTGGRDRVTWATMSPPVKIPGFS